MNEDDRKQVADLLKRSFAPVNRELGRDLWPEMLRRLDQHSPGRLVVALSSVPWFDWALFALLVIGVSIFPKSIPIWLYHF